MDASSLALLRVVMEKIKAQGYRVCNADVTILAQRPKLAAYKDAMRQNLAEVLEVEPSGMNIKATTGEGLGFIGRAEGMRAEAVVLLETAHTETLD